MHGAVSELLYRDSPIPKKVWEIFARNAVSKCRRTPAAVRDGSSTIPIDYTEFQMNELPNGFTREQIASCITQKRLDLTILPTEKCNFRCTYCYEDFLHGRMAPHVVEGVCGLISRRAPNLSELMLQWFGGEPLLALPVVRTILAHSLALSKKHGFRLYGGFTTNAYLLTAPLLEELVGYGQSFFQITLDGWQERHNLTRRRADGQGTFDRIWSNLLSYRQLSVPFEVQLRVHIAHDNLESLKLLCQNIRQEFGTDDRFSVDLEDIRDFGGNGSNHVVILSKNQSLGARAQLAQILYPDDADRKAAASQINVSESAGNRSTKEKTSPAPYICYASKPNQLLIRSTGRIGKCTVLLNDDRNDIGYINRDGTVVLDNDKYRNWIDGLSDLSVERLGCPAHHLNETIAARRARFENVDRAIDEHPIV
jgi:uncharacterized protein